MLPAALLVVQIRSFFVSFGTEMRVMSARWDQLLEPRSTGPSEPEIELAAAQIRDAFNVATAGAERMLELLCVQLPAARDLATRCSVSTACSCRVNQADAAVAVLSATVV